MFINHISERDKRLPNSASTSGQVKGRAFKPSDQCIQFDSMFPELHPGTTWDGYFKIQDMVLALPTWFKV